MAVDGRDATILCHLMRDPRAPADALGRAVGITGAAVAARVQRMAHVGILNGYCVTPSAASLGCEEVWWGYSDVPGGFDIETLWADDVAWISRIHPGLMIVGQRVEPGMVPDHHSSMEVLGTPSDGPHRMVEGVPADAALSPLDWRVFLAVLREPRAPVVRLAELAGLSAKTARRHLAAMIESKAMLITPNVDATREPGVIVGQAYVRLEGNAPPPTRLWPDCVQIGTHLDPPAVVLFGALPNLADVRDLEARLSRGPGVLDVQFVVPQDLRTNIPVVERQIQARLEAWQQARRGRSPG